MKKIFLIFAAIIAGIGLFIVFKGPQANIEQVQQEVWPLTDFDNYGQLMNVCKAWSKQQKGLAISNQETLEAKRCKNFYEKLANENFRKIPNLCKPDDYDINEFIEYTVKTVNSLQGMNLLGHIDNRSSKNSNYDHFLFKKFYDCDLGIKNIKSDLIVKVDHSLFKIPPAYFGPELMSGINGSWSKSRSIDSIPPLRVLLPDISAIKRTDYELEKAGDLSKLGGLIVYTHDKRANLRRHLNFSLANAQKPPQWQYGLFYVEQKRGVDSKYWYGEPRNPQDDFQILIKCHDYTPKICSMYFSYESFQVLIGFSDEKWVKDWKEIRNNALSQLNRFKR